MSCNTLHCPKERHQIFTDEPLGPYAFNCMPHKQGFQCTDRELIDTRIEPVAEQGFFTTFLNVMGIKFNTEKTPTSEADPLIVEGAMTFNGCDSTRNTFSMGPDNTFIGTNPLLFNAARAQRLALDRPNYTGKPLGNVGEKNPSGNSLLAHVYSSAYTNYGKDYLPDYSNVNTGQIQYYVNSDIAEPYYEPVFVTPAKVHKVLYTDPMGVQKPEYNRESSAPYMFNACDSSAENCLSSTHDALEFRQELMEKQMAKVNQSRYSNWNF
jgi:hypothetical protein